MDEEGFVRVEDGNVSSRKRKKNLPLQDNKRRLNGIVLQVDLTHSFHVCTTIGDLHATRYDQKMPYT